MPLELSQLALGFGLVLMRVGAFVASCPLFISDNVQASVRAVAVCGLTLALYAGAPLAPLHAVGPLAFAAEALLGAGLGLSCRMAAVAVAFAGELIDTNVGYGFARMLNPAISEEAGPMANLSQMLAGVLFYLVGGPHIVMRGLMRSLELYPAGSGGMPRELTELLSRHVGELMGIGALLALPMVLALMVTQLGMALLSRVAPQLNVWAVGLMGTCGMGLIGLWCYTPAWVAGIAQRLVSHGLGTGEVLR